MNDDDDNSRLGMWIAIGTALLVAIGTVLILAWNALDDGTATAAGPASAAIAPIATSTPPVAPAATTAAAPTSTAGGATVSGSVGAAPSTLADADATVDLPLSGELLGKVYFEVGKAGMAAASLATIDTAAAAAGSGSRKLVLSGFHDLSGQAAQNAELAKNRAKAVREALKAKGVSADRIVLRKPAETGSGASPEEARRVEIRLVD